VVTRHRFWNTEKMLKQFFGGLVVIYLHNML